MTAGPVPAGIEIGQLTVRWMVGSEIGDVDRARLDGLVRELCRGPLDDALADALDGHPAAVCLRRVAVPPHHVRWGSGDAELVSGWADAIGRAVRAGMISGDDVVCFASRAHAQADLVVSVLAGNRQRAWAWRLLGLWPAGDWPDAEAVACTVAAAAAERSGALVALAVAAARSATLGRFAECLGRAALAGYTRQAWLAAGGSVRPRPAVRRHADPGETIVGRLAALVRQRSQIVASALCLPAACLAGPAGSGPTASGFRAPGGLEPGELAGSLAESLAVLALLEVEPAMAVHPAAWAAVAATARGLRPATAAVPPPSMAAPDRYHLGPAGGAPADAVRGPAPDGTAAGARPPADGEAGPDPGRPAVLAAPAAAAAPAADGGVTPVPPGEGAVTSWAGLLFLLPVVAGLGIPASVAAEPGDDGTGLRPVLHELGRQLLTRAAPDAGPPGADDPALLAFCGLGPGSEPPGAPAGQAAERTGPAAGSVVSALRELLPGLENRGDGELLLAVCRRHAVIQADPGWIDVDLRLDEVSVDIRRAGLDLDPGYLPWLGCVVRFRYV